MDRAIVSGVTGHLGREVARQLALAGVEIHGLTRQKPERDQPWVRTGRFHHLDGRTETVIDIFKEVRPDTVFHLAGLSRREHRSADIAPFVEANLLLGTQLLEAMNLTECSRFITAGSYLQHLDSEAYRAANLYAATKQAFEDIVAYYVDAFGISAVRLTLCDIYSEHDTRPKLMTDIAAAWADATALDLRDAEARVDLVHVEDAATAFLQVAALLESNTLPNRTLSRYSVSSGGDMTALELVAVFERLSGRMLTVNRPDARRSTRRMQPWRGIAVPGWAPRVSLEEGIARILARERCATAQVGRAVPQG